MNKRRDAEISKYERMFEEANIAHETALSSMRRKNGDQTAELTAQIDSLQESRQFIIFLSIIVIF